MLVHQTLVPINLLPGPIQTFVVVAAAVVVAAVVLRESEAANNKALVCRDLGRPLVTCSNDYIESVPQLPRWDP